MSRTRWGYVQVQQRMRKQGTEDATGRKEGPAAWFEAANFKTLKAARYLLSTSSEPRDVGPLLDGMTYTARTRNGRETLTRAQRDAWLREVLDACEDGP